MGSTRPRWAIVFGGMLVVLALGLGLGCGENGGAEEATCTIPASLVTTTLDVNTTVAETTTASGDVDIGGQLAGVWDCIDMPGDYTIEFRADGTGQTYQQGEIGDIFTEFSYETSGDLVTLRYVDDMWQELELSSDGSVLTEVGLYGAFSFERQ